MLKALKSIKKENKQYNKCYGNDNFFSIVFVIFLLLSPFSHPPSYTFFIPLFSFHLLSRLIPKFTFLLNFPSE